MNKVVMWSCKVQGVDEVLIEACLKGDKCQIDGSIDRSPSTNQNSNKDNYKSCVVHATFLTTATILSIYPSCSIFMLTYNHITFF